MGRDNRANRYTPETREPAVWMVLENESNDSGQSAPIRAITPKIGCSRESLRRWVAGSEIDRGRRDGVSSDTRAAVVALRGGAGAGQAGFPITRPPAI